MFTKLWRRIASRTHRPHPNRAGRNAACLLSLERLEDRCVTSGVVQRRGRKGPSSAARADRCKRDVAKAKSSKPRHCAGRNAGASKT
jgi:hypothetical protein